MTQQLLTTAIVRARGQLTIPDSIRGEIGWISPGSVVSLATVKSDEIVIRPHSSRVGAINWNKLWRNIELARSHKGTYQGSLSQFITEDRESRR